MVLVTERTSRPPRSWSCATCRPPSAAAEQAGSTITALAERRRLKLYDAAYPELAQRRRLPLATLDRDLAAAAGAEGVVVLGM